MYLNLNSNYSYKTFFITLLYLTRFVHYSLILQFVSFHFGTFFAWYYKVKFNVLPIYTVSENVSFESWTCYMSTRLLVKMLTWCEAKSNDLPYDKWRGQPRRLYIRTKCPQLINAYNIHRVHHLVSTYNVTQSKCCGTIIQIHTLF